MRSCKGSVEETDPEKKFMDESAAPDEIGARALGQLFAGQLFNQHQTQGKRRAFKQAQQRFQLKSRFALLNLEAFATVEAVFHGGHVHLPNE